MKNTLRFFKSSCPHNSHFREQSFISQFEALADLPWDLDSVLSSSQLAITPIPGDLMMSSSGLWKYQARMRFTYMHSSKTCINNRSNFLIIKNLPLVHILSSHCFCSSEVFLYKGWICWVVIIWDTQFSFKFNQGC